MARGFTAASLQQLTQAEPIAGAPPCTVAIWARFTSLTNSPYPWTIGDGATVSWMGVRVQSTGEVRAQHVNAAGGNGQAVHAGTVVVNQWTHLCGVFTSDSSRSIFVNGAGKVTDTTVVTPFTADLFTVGSYRDGSAGSSAYTSGSLAECGVWNVALTDAEVLQLARGYAPSLVRRSALIGYWSLRAGVSPEPDRGLTANHPLTLVNAPPLTAHPPGIIYPALTSVRGGRRGRR